VKFGLPDLRRWPLQTIEGDYRFDKGFMDVSRFSIASPQLGMEASGIIELATGKISLDVELKSPASTVLGALDIKTHVSGTVSNPKADLESLKKKAFKATLTNLLQGRRGATEENVKEALKNLFR
jgi:redox-regulated HSP33 family molecular chaperone